MVKEFNLSNQDFHKPHTGLDYTRITSCSVCLHVLRINKLELIRAYNCESSYFNYIPAEHLIGLHCLHVLWGFDCKPLQRSPHCEANQIPHFAVQFVKQKVWSVGPSGSSWQWRIKHKSCRKHPLHIVFVTAEGRDPYAGFSRV